LVQIASTLVLMPLLLRVLGVAQFGVWGSASSLAWFSGLVDIGIGTALVTLVARSVAAGNQEEARMHLTGALSFGSGIAALMLAATVVVGALMGWQNGSAPFLIAVAGLALNVPLNSANNAWMALQKGYVSGFWELVQTLATLAGVVVASGITHDVRVFVAIVYGALVLSNAGSLLHLLITHPELRPHGLAPAGEVRAVLREGFLLFALNLTGGLSFLLDNVLALRLLGPDAAAQMTIALRICMTGLGLLLVISQPLWPAFVEAAEKADRGWIRKGLLRGTALLTGLAVAGSVVLLVFGEKLLRLWLHADLGIGQALLWAIAAWMCTQALGRIPNLLLNALSIIRYQIAFIASTSVAAILLKVMLVRYLGVSGILWATTATVGLMVLPAFLTRLAIWYIRFDGTAVPGHLVRLNTPPIV
jgi:O-antigen/teichoic acid export membrane protein